MCFRPAEANLNAPVRCPICGKINRPDATQCVKCGATESDMVKAGDTGMAAPPAPVAPRTPGIAPAPRKTPAPPKAPSAQHKR